MSKRADIIEKEAAQVFHYHDRTKHRFNQYARSSGYLDWANEPNPFRRFEGAPLIRFSRPEPLPSPAYAQCFQPGVIAPTPVTLETLSRLFRNALALSAWKRYERNRWPLRVNPSSGDLHPTEGYLVSGALEGLPAGVYHYTSEEHALERRAALQYGTFEALVRGFPEGSFLVGLSSIFWREAWKYGERAFRYCQLDLGHALAALRISAAVLGWQLTLLDELADAAISTLLGLDRAADFMGAEPEHPEAVAVVVPSAAHLSACEGLAVEALPKIAGASWHGRANRLSAQHVAWAIIDGVARASAKERTALPAASASLPAGCEDLASLRYDAASAEQIIRQRRSAVDFDGVTAISKNTFLRMLARLMPDRTPVPFDALQRSALRRPRLHLGIFAHRIEGLAPGLYFLVRDPAAGEELRRLMQPHFAWSPLEGCPSDIPLFLLGEGDLRELAARLGCAQAIAADGAFALALLAEFEEPIRKLGTWFYRRLFWEAGLLGQILYLEAEAAGVRATGMGCYFDDAVHEILGFGSEEKRFQDIYHFTVGGPLEDARLTTEPPYVT